MSIIGNNSFKNQVQKIVEYLDALDGKDNVINVNTWKNFAPGNLKNDVAILNNLSIFNASVLINNAIKHESSQNVETSNDIGEKWYSELLSIANNKYESCIKQNQMVMSADALYVDKTKSVIAASYNVDSSKKSEAFEKETIVFNMYSKWSKIFKNSPLGKDFYNKLYDVIKTMNCTIDDSNFDSNMYSSKTEQTMDEVIAIFAGEAKLNPKAKNGQYRGLFQLAAPGLKDLQKWAAKNPDVPGMNNIRNININQFAALSGCAQLDYLVAYIGKAKEYSKIPENQSITPGQLWAMIKYPFKGQSDSGITAQKNEAIQNVFTNSSVPHGSET